MEMVHGVALSESEQVIRDFNVTRMERPKADGHLLITNRRIVFASEASGPLGGRSALLREVHLQDVAGITGYLGKGWPIGRVILIAVLSLVFIIAGFGLHFLWILLVWPAYLLWRMLSSQGTEIVLNIHSRSTQESPVSIVAEQSTGLFGLFGSHRALAGVVLGPGPDAEAAIRDVGAMVLDIQTLGDHAIAKWQQPTTLKPTAGVAEPTAAASADTAATFFHQ